MRHGAMGRRKSKGKARLRIKDKKDRKNERK
jgi:hypothetical protein